MPKRFPKGAALYRALKISFFYFECAQCELDMLREYVIRLFFFVSEAWITVQYPLYLWKLNAATQLPVGKVKEQVGLGAHILGAETK